MQKYIAGRLLIAIPTILGAMTVIFLLMRVLPGDVARSILFSEEAGSTIDQKTYLYLREKLGLDRPIYLQYLDWVGGVIRFDLGKSLLSQESVRTEMLHRLPITIQLALMATVIGFALGVPLGIIAAYRQDSFYDYGLRGFAALGIAVPHFWLAVLILMLGLRWFSWSPPVGYHPLWEGVGMNLKQMIWPAMIVGLGAISSVSRLTRSTMLEVLREDYVRTARAKGLSERTLLVRHALRNALIPVVTILGLSLINGLAGSVIMEQIFTIPGVGLYLIEAVRLRDYPIVQAIILMMVVSFVLMNLLVDIFYGWLDPRIRYA